MDPCLEEKKRLLRKTILDIGGDEKKVQCLCQHLTPGSPANHFTELKIRCKKSMEMVQDLHNDQTQQYLNLKMTAL
jgi:hypothetical protein